MSKLENQILGITKDLYDLTDEEHKALLKVYRSSVDTIQKQIAELFIQYAVDGKLSATELYKYNRLVSIEEQIKAELTKLGNIELEHFNTILPELYSQSFYQNAYAIETAIGATISFTLLNPNVVKEAVSYNWSGVPFSERIWSNQNALYNALRTEIAQGAIQGTSIDKMAKNIRDRFNSSYHNSQRLMRTESARIVTEAQEKIYQESEVVESLIYTATLDGRTSKICRKYDGKKWTKDDSTRPKIPAHPNCRSCWIPAIEGFEPKQRKDNESKELIAYSTYEEWAKAKGIK